jgi:hypothetical protein
MGNLQVLLTMDLWNGGYPFNLHHYGPNYCHLSVLDDTNISFDMYVYIVHE